MSIPFALVRNNTPASDWSPTIHSHLTTFIFASFFKFGDRPEVSADVRLCRTTRSQRPDAMVSEVDGLAYASCYGYSEVKAKNTDRYGKQLDLARLAIVGKDTIDAHSHNHVLLFQVVGESMTFYLEYLAAEATYIVAKLNRINLPRSITEIEGFTAVVPSLYIPFIM